MTTTATALGPTVRWTGLSDPLVRPLLDELALEYATRYEGILAADEIRAELDHYPAAEFAAPGGGLLLRVQDGQPVAGGAFRRRVEAELGDARWRERSEGRDEHGVPTVPTAELKRIWTHHAHRRRGHAARVVVELERRAARRGYRRIYLTTGPRQPEAVALYLSTGYTPLFDPAADATGPLPFEKWVR